VLPTISLERSVSEFCARHLRWCQMRRRISPAAYSAELLMNPIPIAVVLLAWSRMDLAVVAAIATFVKCASDAMLLKRLRGSVDLADIVWIPIKDLMVLVVWLLGFVRRTVRWRGNRFRIGAGSHLTPARVGWLRTRRAA
jgi:ceramide glucosyltransferase